jgi:endonuclease/exonuclease/phosphatase family metal-dependent hydrolase
MINDEYCKIDNPLFTENLIIIFYVSFVFSTHKCLKINVLQEILFVENRISYFFRTMVKFIRKVNLWVIFFTLLAYITPYVSPETMSFLTFVGLAYPWLLLLNLIFIFIWAASRMRYWWYSAACILLGFGYLMSVFGIHFLKKNTSEATLKVVSFNIGATLSYENTIKKLNDFIKKQEGDIVCFQEFAHNNTGFNNAINIVESLNAYPYKMRIEGSSNAIFSKFPIVSKKNIPFDFSNGGNGCNYADIKLSNNKIIRVYNAHLESNSVSGIADYLTEKAEFDKKATWGKVLTMLKLVRRNARKRANQAEKIAQHIASSPYPVIVCGDFNDIPVSYTYNIMSKNLTDAFKTKGSGFGTTYSGNIPALKIDYILTDKKITPLSFDIPDVRFSDHFPVVSEVKVEN